MHWKKGGLIGFLLGASISSILAFVLIDAWSRDLTKVAPSIGGGIEFHTNLPTSELLIEESSRVSRFKGPILYKTHAAYSSYFSEQYGFPTELVDADMPDFVDYFAMDIKYAGAFSSCKIKMLLDKDGPIPLPEYDLYQPFSGGNLNMMRSALPKRNTDAREKGYQREYRVQESDYVNRKGLADTIHSSFALVGLHDKSDPEGRSASYTIQIEVLKHQLFSEWDYIELSTFCNPMAKAVFSHNWVAVLGNPMENKRDFLPSPRTLDRAVQIPVPAAVKESVERDLSKISFN